MNLVKQAKAESENTKVSIRNIRKDANDELKKLDGLSEDVIKDAENSVQDVTNEFSSKVDAFFHKKNQK